MRGNIFSLRLKELRKSECLTQQKLSELLGIKCTTLKNYEIGHSYASTDTFIAICDFFNVTANYMLGRTNDPYKSNRKPKDEKMA